MCYISVAKTLHVTPKPRSTPENREINKDRLEIIEIIEQLLAEGKTIPAILIKLDYQKIKRDGTTTRLDKTTITRLKDIHDPNAPSTYGNKVDNVLYSDLREQFRVKYPEYPKEEIFPFTERDVLHRIHDDLYIYYYESRNEYTNKSFINCILIGFNVDVCTGEWAYGVFYYLTNDFRKKGEREFGMKHIGRFNEDPSTVFFQVEDKYGHINSFTIQINRRNIFQRGILPLTYSVFDTKSNLPSVGMGILERIEDDNFVKRIKDLADNGVDPKISNALYQSKYIQDMPVYNHSELFKNDQMYGLNKVKGIWSGTYVRTDFSKDSSTEKGAKCLFFLNVNPNGECELFFEKSATEKYLGFIKFPYEMSTFITGDFSFSEKEKFSRVSLFLSVHTDSIEQYSYEGTIAGWRQTGEKLYGSQIYMRKISEVITKIHSLADMEAILYKQYQTEFIKLVGHDMPIH